MIYSYNLTTSVSSPGQVAQPNDGIDKMALIQLLLIEDYDSQLKDMATMIRGTTNAKKAYREQIVKLRSLLTRPVDNPDEADASKKIIRLDPGMDLGLVDRDEDIIKLKEFMVDEKGQVQEFDGRGLGKIAVHETDDHDGNIIKWTVSVKAVETVVESLNDKLHSLNEQSELSSISLQTLASQRKIAFESLSQLSKSQIETLSTIVHNLK